MISSDRVDTIADLRNETYYYDEAAAEKVVEWFPKNLRHSKGKYAGQRFILSPWQADNIIRPVFGTKRESDGYRRYQTVWIEIPKKNGKSTLASAIATYLLVGDGEFGAEVYCAACDKEQARIVFNQTKMFIQASSRLRRHIKVLGNSIYCPRMNSVMRPLSKEVPNADGLNIHGLVFDEIHRQENNELWKVLDQGGAAREQWLRVVITTAGIFDPTSLYTQMHDYAKEVEKDPMYDPSWYVYILSADEDKWEDPEEWYRVNPELGKSLNLRMMQSAYNKASNVSLERTNFKRLRLNIISQEATKVINMGAYDSVTRVVDMEKMKGKPCFGGMDLSSTRDFTSVVLLFPYGNPVDETFVVYPFFFLPEGAIKNPENKLLGKHYEIWAEEGYIEVTPGDYIDYDQIVSKYEFDFTEFKLGPTGYDPWNAISTVVRLESMGYEMVEVRQGWGTISDPTKQFIRLCGQGKIIHNGNPVLRWMASNLVVSEDKKGNMSPDKEESPAKIDGVVATINSLYVYGKDDLGKKAKKRYNRGRGLRSM